MDLSARTLKNIVPTAWENSAIAHALVMQQVAGKTVDLTAKNKQKDKITLEYRLPALNLDHVKKMTTDVGIIQFSKINQPDIETGYTIDAVSYTHLDVYKRQVRLNREKGIMRILTK